MTKLDHLLGACETLIEAKREGYDDDELRQYALIILKAALSEVEQEALQGCS